MLDLLMKRRSIRKYKQEPVEVAKLEKIIQAALLSPSSRGRTPWEFVVVQNRETLKALGRCRHPQQAFLPDTPAAIVVLGDHWDSGVVGLGGAAFPLWGKLDAIRKNQIDTVLVNAAECEPYITSDTRMMVDHTDLVVKGVHLLHKWMNAKKVVICIEDNKQEAIAKLREALAGEDWAEIFILPAIYPQGAKQVLLYNVTGQVVKGGQRMASLGVIIINVSSTAKMAQYMETGMPLVDRIVTIDGSAVKEPKNLIAPIGTPISYLVEQAGGLSCEPGKVLIGGPMLGAAVASMDEPSKKATNSLLFLTEKEAKIYEPTACIRCGRCVANCPVSLNPAALARAMENENEDVRFVKLQEYSVGQCIECACCSYVCPAHKPLMESNKQGKRFVKKYKAAHAEGGK